MTRRQFNRQTGYSEDADEAPFNIHLAPNHKIKSSKLRDKRLRYQIKPRRSPQRHAITKKFDRDRLRFWQDTIRQEADLFKFFIGTRFYKVSTAGYLIEDPRVRNNNEPNGADAIADEVDDGSDSIHQGSGGNEAPANAEPGGGDAQGVVRASRVSPSTLSMTSSFIHDKI
jgi:hypothetical protein